MVDNVALSDLGKDELLEIIRKQASQIQALQVILYTRYRPYRSYFIPDIGLTGHTLYQI